MVLAGNNGQEDRIRIVEVKITRSRVLPNPLVVKEDLWILFQNARMLALEFRSEAAQDGDRETLRPSMLQQSQACHERERLVIRKPHFDPPAGRVTAVEGIVCPLRISGPRIAAKTAVRLQEPLQTGSQLGTRPC